ncbi:GPW/gp25 family protein [Pasteurella skyensis]|uniref:GPW/gp25 family protein n=1 Tax=Phocoenobacter skyensis TaxID=97481 RepID=UPI0027582550|nr:GPW/gp25 family protein [Pasteurella skyensis]MDP8176353.1 GPW/gp25 family protein [Pasteurella skyensis]MDP8199134.1 GPW/gp25 family protein [Pasteurella skyensis]
MNKQTGERLTDEKAHIQQSIQDILLTAVGSRVMRRDYGSYLYKLIDRPISHALTLQISACCVMALKKWEHRIEVTRFLVSFNQDMENPAITAEIEATIKDGGNTKLKAGIQLV